MAAQRQGSVGHGVRTAVALAATLALATVGALAMGTPARAQAEPADVSSITLGQYYVDMTKNASVVYNGAAQMPDTLTLTATSTDNNQPQTITATVNTTTQTTGTYAITKLSWDATDNVNAGSIDAGLTDLNAFVSSESSLQSSFVAPQNAGTYYLFVKTDQQINTTLAGTQDPVTISGTTVNGNGDDQSKYAIEQLDFSDYTISAEDLTYDAKALSPVTLTLTPKSTANGAQTVTLQGTAADGQTGVYNVTSGAIGDTNLTGITGVTFTTTKSGEDNAATPTNLENVGDYGVTLTAEGSTNFSNSATGTITVEPAPVEVTFTVGGKASETTTQDPQVIQLSNTAGLTVTVNFDLPSWVSDETTATATASVTANGAVLLKSTAANATAGTSVANLSDGDAFVIVPQKTGAATITLRLTLNPTDDNIATTPASYYVQVEGQETYTLTLDPTSMTYNGKVAAPEATVTDEADETVNADDYELEWYLDEECTKPTGPQDSANSGATTAGGAPINAGTYYVRAVLTSDGDEVYSDTATFTISKAQIAVYANPPSPLTLTLPTDAAGKSVMVMYFGVDQKVMSATGAASIATAATTTASSYVVKVTGGKVMDDTAGDPQFICDFTFTNNSQTAISPLRALDCQAFQNGFELGLGNPAGIPSSDFNMNTQFSQVEPGATGTFQEIFALSDESTVTVKVSDISYIGETDANLLVTAEFDPQNQMLLNSTTYTNSNDGADSGVIELANATGIQNQGSFTVIPKKAGKAQVTLTVTPPSTDALLTQNYAVTPVAYEVIVDDNTPGAGGGTGGGAGGTGSGGSLPQTGDASATAFGVIVALIAASVAAMVVAKRRERLLRG